MCEPVQKMVKTNNTKLMKYLCYTLLLLMLLHQVEAEKFDCHFDRCNTDDDQYCNEEDERCYYCDCSLPVIPECQDICARKKTSTTPTSTITPTSTMSTTSTTSTTSRSTVSGNAVVGFTIFVIAIFFAVIVFYLYKTKKFCFAPSTTPDSPDSSAASSDDSLLKIEDRNDVGQDQLQFVDEKKRPVQEEGRDLLHGSYKWPIDQFHTSPTDDLCADQHKKEYNPSEIAIHKLGLKQSDETGLKMVC